MRGQDSGQLPKTGQEQSSLEGTAGSGYILYLGPRQTERVIINQDGHLGLHTFYMYITLSAKMYAFNYLGKESLQLAFSASST